MNCGLFHIGVVLMCGMCRSLNTESCLCPVSFPDMGGEKPTLLNNLLNIPPHTSDSTELQTQLSLSQQLSLNASHSLSLLPAYTDVMALIIVIKVCPASLWACLCFLASVLVERATPVSLLLFLSLLSFGASTTTLCPGFCAGCPKTWGLLGSSLGRE